MLRGRPEGIANSKMNPASNVAHIMVNYRVNLDHDIYKLFKYIFVYNKHGYYIYVNLVQNQLKISHLYIHIHNVTII